MRPQRPGGAICRTRIWLFSTSCCLSREWKFSEVIAHDSQPDGLRETSATFKNDASNERPEFQARSVDYAESDTHPNQNKERAPEATHRRFRLIVWQTLQAPQSTVVVFFRVINCAENGLVASDKPCHVHGRNKVQPLRVAAAAFFDQASLTMQPPPQTGVGKSG